MHFHLETMGGFAGGLWHSMPFFPNRWSLEQKLLICLKEAANMQLQIRELWTCGTPWCIKGHHSTYTITRNPIKNAARPMPGLLALLLCWLLLARWRGTSLTEAVLEAPTNVLHITAGTRMSGSRGKGQEGME